MLRIGVLTSRTAADAAYTLPLQGRVTARVALSSRFKRSLMAALVLSVAGAAVGGAVFGPAGAIAGRIAGAIGGSLIDRALFSSHTERNLEGPRLADLDVMASTEGAPIPLIYGRSR